MRVALLVSTRDRLKALDCWLESTLRLIIPEGVDLIIVVADNNDASQETEIRAIGKRLGLEIVYGHALPRGYATPRNKSLELALVAGADILVLTDDDCTLDPSLITSHLERLETLQADVVHGSWAGVPQQAEGRRMTRGVACGNVSMKRWVAEKVKFDERLNLLGAEDLEYFREAHEKGAVVMKSYRPIVHSNAAAAALPPVEPWGLLISNGRNRIVTERLRRGRLDACAVYASRYALFSLRSIAAALGGLAIRLAGRDAKAQWTQARKDALHFWGATQGLFLNGIDRAEAKANRIVPVHWAAQHDSDAPASLRAGPAIASGAPLNPAADR